MEAEVQILVNAPREARSQAMDSLLQRRAAEGLLAKRPYEWRRDHEEVVDLKRQMNLIEEAYDKMKEWGTYVDGHNQAMADTVEEAKAIMMNLQKKDEYYREKYLKLVILSNDLIDEIPQSLEEAKDMMNIFKPQKDICDFLKSYRYMVVEFRFRIKERY